jgi:hypothetical protein
VLMIAQPRRGRCEPGDLTDSEVAGRVYRQARCAGLRTDPDEWFPIAEKVDKARDQAANAIAACAGCPVRPDCLELSLRHAYGTGALAAARLRYRCSRSVGRRWASRAGTTVAARQLAGTSVTDFLRLTAAPGER